MVPPGATIQYGLGKLPEAVVQAVANPVSVVSGLVTDAVCGLAERDLLVGQVLACYAWGHGASALAQAGGIRPVGIEELHRDHRLAATPRFVAINTALEVGLDGSVNVERAGSRLVAGIGGHADYCAAASQSEGGLSIIVLPSTHRGRSSIVAVPSVVSTARADVCVVVTEHGVADLRALDEEGRRRALLAIADPAHRDELERAGRDKALG
jgi:acyl-CoA hydrolase